MLSFLRDADVLDAWLSSQRNQIESDNRDVNLALCEEALQEVERQQGNANAWMDKVKQIRIQTKVCILFSLKFIFNLFLIQFEEQVDVKKREQDEKDRLDQQIALELEEQKERERQERIEEMTPSNSMPSDSQPPAQNGDLNGDAHVVSSFRKKIFEF